MKFISSSVVCFLLLFGTAIALANPISFTLPMIGGEYGIPGQTGSTLFLLMGDTAQQYWNANTHFDDLDVGMKEELHLKFLTCEKSTCIALATFTTNHEDKVFYKAPLKVNNRRDLHFILLTSQDSGQHWKKIETIKGLSTLATLTNVEFFAPICDENSCFMVGQDFDSLEPRMLISNDNAITWQYISNVPGLPTILGSPPKCQAKDCIMIGLVNFSSEKADIFNSHDGGLSWKENTRINAPVDFTVYNDNALAANNLACQDEHCMVAGSRPVSVSSHPEAAYPAFLVSEDKGNTWAYVDKDKVSLPKNMESGYISNLECYDRTCVAVGIYTFHDVSKPLILISNDDGHTWMYIDSEILFALSNISAFSCIDNRTCIFVDEFSHVAVASSGKSGWSMNNDLVHIPSLTELNINAVKCNKQICLMTGKYKEIQNKILILSSFDSGLTWAQNKNIQGIIPNGSAEGRVIS